jgi:hypothetical protein
VSQLTAGVLLAAGAHERAPGGRVAHPDGESATADIHQYKADGSTEDSVVDGAVVVESDHQETPGTADSPPDGACEIDAGALTDHDDIDLGDSDSPEHVLSRGGPSDDLDVRLAFQQARNPVAHRWVIVDHEDRDHEAHPGEFTL